MGKEIKILTSLCLAIAILIILGTSSVVGNINEDATSENTTLAGYESHCYLFSNTISFAGTIKAKDITEETTREVYFGVYSSSGKLMGTWSGNIDFKPDTNHLWSIKDKELQGNVCNMSYTFKFI